MDILKILGAVITVVGAVLVYGAKPLSAKVYAEGYTEKNFIMLKLIGFAVFLAGFAVMFFTFILPGLGY